MMLGKSQGKLVLKKGLKKIRLIYIHFILTHALLTIPEQQKGHNTFVFSGYFFCYYKKKNFPLVLLYVCDLLSLHHFLENAFLHITFFF